MNDKRSRPMTADERRKSLSLLKTIVDFLFYLCAAWIVIGLLSLAGHPDVSFHIDNAWIGVLCLIAVYPLYLLRKRIAERLP